MAKGNPNPSPETRFGGPRGNMPNGGKTSDQRKAEYEASEKAAQIGLRMISSIMENIEDGQDALDFLDQATLKLLKDVQDRAHGTPRQSIEHSGDEDKPIAVTGIERVIVTPDASKQ